MLLSELNGKEIVDLCKAEKLGLLGQIDLEIDVETGQIISLVIPIGEKPIFWKKQSEIRIPWNQINKIGENIILVEVPNIEKIDE